MFTKSAWFYNAIYSSLGKDYAAESLKIHELVTQYKHSAGNTLLDVDCGTGLHAINLSRHYQNGREDGVNNFTELHELGLFTREQYLEAFRSADLQVVDDQEGLMGRGLYTGTKN